MGLLYFEIKLENNPSGVYFGGDVVQGKMLFGLEGSAKKARGVRVEIKGKSEVRWTSGSGDNKKTYQDTETYIDERQYVIGDSSNEMHIAAGDYEYPFQFQLPVEIPSSFVGEHGDIVYRVKGVIDRPWKFDHEAVAFFNVVGVYDLNLDPEAGNPQTVSDQKTLGCLCCISGPVSATVKVNRSGYVPGETIYLEATADNESDSMIEKTQVKLVQSILFYAQGQEKEDKTTILELEKGEVEPGESENWQDTALHIPALPPSKLIHCDNIEIKYNIVFRVMPIGCSFSLRVFVPVVIGTIPLRSTFSQFQRLPSEDNPSENQALPTPFTGNTDFSCTGPFSAYPDLPPPTYEEAKLLPSIERDNVEEHATGNWDFRPIYPYYG